MPVKRNGRASAAIGDGEPGQSADGTATWPSSWGNERTTDTLREDARQRVRNRPAAYEAGARWGITAGARWIEHACPGSSRSAREQPNLL